jgi:hypothetical protein
MVVDKKNSPRVRTIRRIRISNCPTSPGRYTASSLGLPMTGTLGLLLYAKRAGPIPTVTPALDTLQSLRFRLSAQTRDAVMRLAGESTPQVAL